MDVVLTAAGSVLVVIGALAFVTAGLGLIRFPDPYTRVSAVGTAGGVGMILIVVGALLLAPGVAAFVKVALIVVLQLGSASVATMALARSAYLTGVPMNPGHYDELAEDTPGREGGRAAPRLPDMD